MNEPDPRRWRALAVCLVAGFMTLLDVSIVNVALPPIQRGIGASSAELSWVVSGYALTFGLVLVSSGRLGDDRGRKRMFMISLALFTVTSALAGVAPNAAFLVVMRLLQGVAGGMLNPQVIGFIQQLFRGPERGRAFGLFGAAIGVSTAVGPVTGGLLLQVPGPIDAWRYVFYVNIPIGIVALVLGLRWLPHDEPAAEKRPLDLVGALLLGAAVVALMFPLVLSEQDPASAPWWLIAVFAVLLVAFVFWERRAKRAHGHPLVNFALLRRRSYALGTSLGLLYFAGFTSIFFVLTLYYQQGEGYSPLAAGLALTPFAVGSAVTSAVGGRLVSGRGNYVVVGGLVLVVVGLVATDLVLRADPTHVGWVTAGPLLVAGLGSGFVIAPNQTLALAEVPPAEGGTAAGVLQTGQRIGSAIGISAVGALFFGELSDSPGDYAGAIGTGLVVTVGLVALALVLGLVDLVTAEIARRRDRATASPAPDQRAPDRQDGATTEEPEGPAADAAPAVHGRVTDTEGSPLEGAVLTLVDDAGGHLAHGRTGADGTFRLPTDGGADGAAGPDRDGAAVDLVQLVARADGYRPEASWLRLAGRDGSAGGAGGPQDVVHDVALESAAGRHARHPAAGAVD